MTRSRYRFEAKDNHAYFLTSTTVGWLPVFACPEAAQIVLDSWQFLIQHNRMTLYGYVIMENHLHFIASSPDLSKEVGDFKSFTARQIIDLLRARKHTTLLEQLHMFRAEHKTDRIFQLYQEGSHPQQLIDDDMMRQKLEYMHLNPVRRRYVDDPLHWRYSSARNYAGLKGLIEVTTTW